ncbi:Orotidine 5'-phosphate decarboxylase [Commensalibacter sp. Nvir]|uniref:orotidine-5'-phosphate decarboxylase n=1 Tax=Commensalibacter sp. Nvir TaxID=3069817 RepID=UPI002D65F573|nr:Orotidine 5'-phosphate decarboxylase [Commensalibacter sp. Nvir]
MTQKTKLIIAADTKKFAEVKTWIEIADETGQMIKIGMECMYALGLDNIKNLTKNKRFFLDLKLHDIPNTVASAIGSLSVLNPSMLTIHTLGGEKMIKAAREAVNNYFELQQRPLLLGVTVLTSMDQSNLYSIGIEKTPLDQVLLLAEMALENGVDGLVCSPQEVFYLRERLGKEISLIVPGIRLERLASDDQQRVMTPKEARQAGASWIVVGRPITKASDPRKIVHTILEQIQG